MSFEQTAEVTPGPLTMEQADMLNAMALEVWRLSTMEFTPPLLKSDSSSLAVALDLELPFLAKITGNGLDSANNTIYTWTEQQDVTNGGTIDLPTGRTGTLTLNPAYERNLGNSVPTNTIVEMHRGFLNLNATRAEYWFQAVDIGTTTLQVVTSICATFLPGPLDPPNGGTGSSLASTGGPGQYLNQPTAGANLTPTNPANDPAVGGMWGVIGP